MWRLRECSLKIVSCTQKSTPKREALERNPLKLLSPIFNLFIYLFVLIIIIIIYYFYWDQWVQWRRNHSWEGFRQWRKLHVQIRNTGPMGNLREFSPTTPSLSSAVWGPPCGWNSGSSSSSPPLLWLSTSSTTSCLCPRKYSPATSVTLNSPPPPSATTASKSSLMASWYLHSSYL